ncbi:MAG: hypothetical protein KF704_11125 [Crocinitomicaceae bacterium]|nr:hypothetical protein [Crocinitomicaceae bacterium]NGF74736.1 hypothetical protein [Fluviicola sp. SGL-29]
MTFTITFRLNNDTSVTSKDVIQTSSTYQQSLIERYNLSCTLQLHHAGGTWEIEDELPVLIANFFLRSVRTLLRETSASYEYFEYQGQVALELIDGNVCISGDFVEDLMIAFNSFREFSIELGKHAVELLEQLDHQKFQPDLEFIRQVLAQVTD